MVFVGSVAHRLVVLAVDGIAYVLAHGANKAFHNCPVFVGLVVLVGCYLHLRAVQQRGYGV